MKYVFHNAFVSSSAPKAAEEIISLIKKAVGSEMLPKYFPIFFCRLKEMAAEANEKGKVTLTVELHEEKNIHGEGIVNRSIHVTRKRNYGYDDVARLYCVSVKSEWIPEVEEEELKSDVDIIRRMAEDLQNGVSEEAVADKYAVCASQELREELIDGLKAIVKKGGEA